MQWETTARTLVAIKSSIMLRALMRPRNSNPSFVPLADQKSEEQ